MRGRTKQKEIVLICDNTSLDTISKYDANYNASDYNKKNTFFENKDCVVYKTFHILGEARTVKSACRWIGIPDYTVYANQRRTGELKSKYYMLEKIKVRDIEWEDVEWERNGMEDDTIHK